MIKVNVTNTYRIESPSLRDSEKRAKDDERGVGKVGAMVDRKLHQLEAEDKAAKLIHHSDNRTAEAAQKRSMEMTIPAEANAYDPVFEVEEDHPRQALGDVGSNPASPALESSSPDQPEAVDYVQRQQANKRDDLHDSDETSRLAAEQRSIDLLPADASEGPVAPEHFDFLREQRASRSVLEEFLEKMLKQSREQESVFFDQTESAGQSQSATRAEMLASVDRQDALDEEAQLQGADALRQRERARDERDDAMFSVHKKIHQAYMEQLAEQVKGSQKVAATLDLERLESNTPRTVRAGSESEAFASTAPEPTLIQLVLPEDYARQLSAALEASQGPKKPPTILDPQPQSNPIATLQKEGVFGLSTGGRNLTITDFIRQKEFEYNLDQKPFTVDDFLQETEKAIYDTLNNGNSTSVTATLLRAAEAVNSFRNHMIRAAEAPSGSTGHPWQDDQS